MYKKLCFNHFVIEKKDVVVGMKVGESVKRMLDRIADDTDRTISYVARELMIRGLALYEADGRLKDEPKPERHLAPVVATITPAIERTPSKAEVRRMINADEIGEIERRITPRKTQRIPQLKQKAK